MKQLIIVRHAKAMKSKEGLPDFVRSLVKKGLKQVKNISKKLKKSGIIPEVFISSPANRALETAQYFARVYGYPRKKIILKDELYGSLTDQEYLSIIKELNDNLSSVIIFGHDPVTSSIVKFLGKNFNEDLPTCSVAVVVFDKDNWKDIAKGQGEVTFFEYPKRMAIYYSALHSEIESEVFTHLMQVFKKTDEKASQANQKQIKKMAKTAVKEFISILKEYKKKEKRMEKVTKKVIQKKVPKKEAKVDTTEKTAETPKDQEKPEE